MRSLALRAFLASTISLLAAVPASASGQAVGSPGAADGGITDFTLRQFVLPPQFMIEGTSSRGERLRVMMTDSRSWSAVLERGGEVWVATDHGCERFRQSLQLFATLPPLTPGPIPLREPARAEELSPSSPHAEAWILRMTGYAADLTVLEMELRGSQGPYPRWATDVSEAVISCGQVAR